MPSTLQSTSGLGARHQHSKRHTILFYIYFVFCSVDNKYRFHRLSSFLCPHVISLFTGDLCTWIVQSTHLRKILAPIEQNFYYIVVVILLWKCIVFLYELFYNVFSFMTTTINLWLCHVYFFWIAKRVPTYLCNFKQYIWDGWNDPFNCNAT